MEEPGRLDDLTRCHVCMDRFGIRYRHLDSDDAKRWNKVPIQSTACTHTLCFPCVEWAVLLGGSTSRTEPQEEPAVKCPLCMADKAFTLKGKVNLAACALAKVVEDRGAVQAADCWSGTSASAASVPPPLLVAHNYANPASGTWGSGAPKSTSYAAGAKRPPVSQGGTQAPSSQPKKKKKSRLHRSSVPAHSMLKPPPPSAAELIDLTRPVRRRTKVQTITEEWNADHERKLAARAMAPDWDVLLASRDNRGGGSGVAEQADHSRQASTTIDGADGSSDVVTTTSDNSATSTEHGSTANVFGAPSDNASPELAPGVVSTENHPTVEAELIEAPSTFEISPDPVDQDAPATSPANKAAEADASKVSSEPIREGIESPSIVSTATFLVVDRESEVLASPSNDEDRDPATATGTSEVSAALMVDIGATKQLPSNNSSLHFEPEDPTGTVDIEVASVMEVDAPAKDSPSIYSIDDEDEDGADEDSEVISFAECPTSASHDATRPFAKAGEYASTPHIAARRKELAMHRCLNSAFEVCPIPAEESDDGLEAESIENGETSTYAPSNGEEVPVHVPSAPSPLETQSLCIDVSHQTKQLDMEAAAADDDMSVIDLTGDESDDDDSVIDLTMDDDSVDGSCNTIEGWQGSWTVVPV